MADVTLSPREVLRVAKAHRAALWCMLGIILLSVFNGAFSSLAPRDMSQGGALVAMVVHSGVFFCSLGLLVAMCIFVYRLAGGLGSKVAVLWSIGMIMPCLNLLFLLGLSVRATRVLRAHGARVGLMGADIVELERSLVSP